MNDLKSRISLTAQELFLTEGVGGVSMRRIADRVGVSATAIYRHFRDKEAILEEIINAGLAILSNYLGPPLQAPDPFQRLKGLIDAYLRFAIEQPRYFISPSWCRGTPPSSRKSWRGRLMRPSARRWSRWACA